MPTHSRQVGRPSPHRCHLAPLITTHLANNNVVPSGQRLNTALIIFSVVTDTRDFLIRLRAFSSSLSAISRGETDNLLGTADIFRATMSAQRSLDWRKGLFFYSFLSPGRSFYASAFKNLGKKLTESIVQEVMEAQGFRVHGVMQLRCGRCEQDASKCRPLTRPTIRAVLIGKNQGGAY